MLELTRNTDAFPVVSIAPGYRYPLGIGDVWVYAHAICYLQSDPYHLLPYHFSAHLNFFDDLWHIECRDVYGHAVLPLSLTFSSVVAAFWYCVEKLKVAESQAEPIVPAPSQCSLRSVGSDGWPLDM